MSTDTPTTERSKRPETVEEAAYQTLIAQHGASQDQRIVGFFKSQSLRQVMEHGPSPHNIVQVRGKRRANESSLDIQMDGYDGINRFLRAEEKRREIATIDYDLAKHGIFPWELLKSWLDENGLVHDIPISRFVIRFENDQFHESMWRYIQGALERAPGLDPIDDRGEFQQPFYAVFQSKAPGKDRIARRILDFHPDRYFLPSSETTPTGERGMGWSRPRTMDLTALWSHQAFVHSGNVVAKDGDGENWTIRDIEDSVVNHVESDSTEYGAINSLLCFNKVRQSFSKATTGRKRFEWRIGEGWEQIDQGETEV